MGERGKEREREGETHDIHLYFDPILFLNLIKLILLSYIEVYMPHPQLSLPIHQSPHPQNLSKLLSRKYFFTFKPLHPTGKVWKDD